MYRILIVDDEKMERDGVEFLIRRRSLPVRIRQAQNGQEALDMWREEPDDIVFMDIKMPVMNGIELCRSIRESNGNTVLVVLSAYGDFAYTQKAIQIRVDDYLLKPFDPDRIREALRRCTAEPAPAASAAPPVLHRIAVNSNRSTTLLDTDEITYIETDGIGRGCILHTISGKSYPDTTSLGEYESRLGEQDFYRIHKTCLVHLRYIVSIFPWTGNSFALRVRSTDSVLPISRERVRELRRRLNI